MDPLAVAGVIGVKLAGAVAGACLALIYLQPKTMAEFVTRSAFSVISGVVFSEGVRDGAKWPSTFNYDLAAAALTAMLSWFVMAMLIRVIDAWKGPK